MKRLVPLAVSASIAAVALLLPANPASASGDSSCYPRWSLYNRDFGCANSAALAPGNDSRVNLYYLLRDRQGATSAGISYPKTEWEARLYGHTYFDWGLLTSAYYPKPVAAEGEQAAGPDYAGSRCVSLPSGDAGFTAAVGAGTRANSSSLRAAASRRLGADSISQSGCSSLPASASACA
jgi:hypothetical protein